MQLFFSSHLLRAIPSQNIAAVSWWCYQSTQATDSTSFASERSACSRQSWLYQNAAVLLPLTKMEAVFGRGVTRCQAPVRSWTRVLTLHKWDVVSVDVKLQAVWVVFHLSVVEKESCACADILYTSHHSAALLRGAFLQTSHSTETTAAVTNPGTVLFVHVSTDMINAVTGSCLHGWNMKKHLVSRRRCQWWDIQLHPSHSELLEDVWPAVMG